MAGKANRKHNRNREFCKEYKAEGRQEYNKEIKLARHKKAHPRDVKQSSAVNYTRKAPLNVFEKLFSKKP